MLILNWKEACKMFSVQAIVIVGVFALLEPFVPVLSQYLPDQWVAYTLPVIVVARLIKQNNLEEDNEKVGLVYE